MRTRFYALGAKGTNPMKVKRILIGLSIIGLLAMIAYGATVKCPICKGNAYFTGETKLDASGKLLKVYQCMMFSDHRFLEQWYSPQRSSPTYPSQRSNQGSKSVKCKICKSNSFFTGETKVDVTGKLLWEYQCMGFPDHVFWVVKK